MNILNAKGTNCSGCGAEHEPTAEACALCGHTIVKPAKSEFQENLQQLINRPWVIVVLMLHVGLLGIPVYLKTSYSLGARLLMVIASIVYTVGAVALIIVMLQWLIRMVTGG